jgi:hypothetical protein
MMNKSIKIATLIALIALLAISCNFPLASLAQKVTGGNGDETNGDADDKSPFGGLFSGGNTGKDSGSSSGNNGSQTKLTEKPLTGELQVLQTAFWPNENGRWIVLAALVKNTDPKLSIFYENLQFELSDKSGQPISLAENQLGYYEDTVLYPGQEFLFCEIHELNGTTPTDVGEFKLTMNSDIKGVDLAITQSPFSVVTSNISDTSATNYFQLRSELAITNSGERLAFFPTVTTGGFDSNGKLVSCGRNFETPGFLSPHGKAASEFRMNGIAYPTTTETYMAQRVVDYTWQDETFPILEANQLTISNIDFIQDGRDVIAKFDLINNTNKSGTFDYILQYSAYDENGYVLGAYTSGRLMGLFGSGTKFGPYHFLQSYVIKDGQVAKLDIDLITLDVYEEDFDVPEVMVEYGEAIFDNSIDKVVFDATNLIKTSIGIDVFVVCLDSGGDWVGFGHTKSNYIEAGEKQKVEAYTFDYAGSSCANAASIKLYPESVSGY